MSAPPPTNARAFARSTRFRSSLAFDVGRFDNRPPSLDLGLLERCKPIWRLLVPRETLLPLRRNSRAKGRIRHHRLNSSTELRDYVCRRALGHPEADPCRSVKSWETCLIDSWNVRRSR